MAEAVWCEYLGWIDDPFEKTHQFLSKGRGKQFHFGNKLEVLSTIDLSTTNLDSQQARCAMSLCLMHNGEELISSN